MKVLSENESVALSFLTSALNGGEWSASGPSLYPQEKSPQYQFYRSLGGPQSRCGQCRVDKNISPHQEYDPDCSSRGTST
jgi:hypothetical protein